MVHTLGVSDPSALAANIRSAFERDPLTAYFSLMVAGNAVHPTQVVTIKGHQVMVPKWGAEGWGWFGQLAHVIQDAAYAGKTPASAVQLSSKLDGYLIKRPDGIQGADFDPNSAVYIDVTPQKGGGIGPAAVSVAKDAVGKSWIGGVVASAGEMVADAARWMKKNKAVVAAVVAGVMAFLGLGPPIVVMAILAWLLANPSELVKVFKTAGELVGKLFGAAVGGLFAGFPIGLIAIGAGLYFYFRGKGAAD